jgi:hypothetical protein
MPRIIVTTDHPVSSTLGDLPVLLSESVNSVHISSDHSASQLMERLAWAIRDAESAEVKRSGRARGANGKRNRSSAGKRQTVNA